LEEKKVRGTEGDGRRGILLKMVLAGGGGTGGTHKVGHWEGPRGSDGDERRQPQGAVVRHGPG